MFEKMRQTLRPYITLPPISGALLGTLLYLGAYGQADLPEIIPPSPQAAAFAKYGDIPVNTYNGLVNVDIPLYTISSRDIKVPISLSYHGGGIKVNEEASWVGLGWVLNAGGVISRNVMGMDDFKYTSGTQGYFVNGIPSIPSDAVFSSFSQDKNQYFQGGCDIYYGPGDGSPVIPLDFSNYLENPSLYDFEPDMYNFSIGGRSGKFILDRNKDAILEKQEKLDIQVLDNSADSWRIKADDGMVYTFAVFEESSESGGAPFIKTAWYLTEIKSPMTGETVTFHYNKVSQEVETVGSVFQSDDIGGGGCDENGFVSTGRTRRYYDRVTLDYIDFTNGRVVFQTGTREDLLGDVKLERMKIYKKQSDGSLEGTPYKEVVFNYADKFGTFDVDRETVNWPASSLPLKYYFNRLKLLSVQEISGTVKKGKHSFEYYDTDGFNRNNPSKNSFARDYWGYYNGRHNNTHLVPEFKGFIIYKENNNFFENNTSILNYSVGEAYYVELPGADREPVPIFTNTYSLRKIIYPTGGETEFTYENHTFDPEASQGNDNSPLGLIPDLQEVDELFIYDASSYVTGSDLGTTKEGTLDLTNGYSFANGLVDVTFDMIFRFNLNIVSKGQSLSGSNINSLGKAYIQLRDANGEMFTVDVFSNSVQPDPFSPVMRYEDVIELPRGKYTWRCFVDGNVSEMAEIRSNFTWESFLGAKDSEGNVAAGTFGTTGGLRIKEIVDRDGENPGIDKIRKFVYHVEEDRDLDGTVEEYSYGKRMARPIHARYAFAWNDNSSGPLDYWAGGYSCSKFIRSSDSNVPLNGTAGGSIVGYDRVRILYGKEGTQYGTEGSSEFLYDNVPDEVQSYLYHRYPGIPNLSYNRNGYLLKQIDKDNMGRSVRELENDYGAKNTRTHYAFKAVPQNLTILATQTGGSPASFPCDISNFIYPAIRSEWLQLLSTTERVYDQGAGGNLVSNTTVYGYETGTPTHYQRISEQTVNSNGEVVRNEREFVGDISLYGAGVLETAHMYNVPLTEKITVNGTSISEIRHHYDDLSNGLVHKFKYEVFPDGNTGPSGDKVTINYGHNLDGNIEQVQQENGMYLTYLWGYNDSYPIAKIENATASQVGTALGGSIPDFGTGGLTAAQENALRGIQGAMVYTYSYDRLIGMLTSTDPNGKVMTYQYDTLGRLQAIKDQQGNVVETFTYHYENE